MDKTNAVTIVRNPRSTFQRKNKLGQDQVHLPLHNLTLHAAHGEFLKARQWSANRTKKEFTLRWIQRFFAEYVFDRDIIAR